MGERKTFVLTQEQLSAIDEESNEDGRADNESEALRMFLNEGMRQYGYRAGENGKTILKAATQRLAWLFVVAGLVGLTFTFAYPVPARVPSFSVFAAGAGLYIASGWLESVEPAVTERLRGLVGGETA